MLFNPIKWFKRKACTRQADAKLHHFNAPWDIVSMGNVVSADGQKVYTRIWQERRCGWCGFRELKHSDSKETAIPKKAR